MLKVAEIKEAIEELPEKDFVQLRQWFSEKDWQKWDKQIEMDSESGKLDFLIEEALDEKSKGQLKELSVDHKTLNLKDTKTQTNPKFQ